MLCTLDGYCYTGGIERTAYPSAVHDDEWTFVAPY